LASIAQEVRIRETLAGEESGHEVGHRVVFKTPRTVDYRASVHDIANYLMQLMQDGELRKNMGEAGRKRAVENFDYRVIAKRFAAIICEKLGIS
jgi:glycosyltransferase involved in cell wall biosynthesis